MKEKIKLVIVFILGIMISVVISVTAATVITGKEVSYTDNKSIGASNVQDAIDGTYTAANNIASRVTELGTTSTGTLSSSYSLNGPTLKKYGAIVCFSFKVWNYNFNSSSPETIATLPSGFRPNSNILNVNLGVAVTSGWGVQSSAIGSINSDGTIKVYMHNGTTTTWTEVTISKCFIQ